MTTRRNLLQGAASLIAPVEIDPGMLLGSSLKASPFGILIDEYQQMLLRLEDIFEDRNMVEKTASARNGHWNGCPEIANVERSERAWYAAEKKLIQLASRTRAASINEVVEKLILWRIVDCDRECFDNAYDMIPFSAYRDLLLLTGCASQTQKADDKALAIVWDDRAFVHCDDDDESDDDEDSDTIDNDDAKRD